MAGPADFAKLFPERTWDALQPKTKGPLPGPLSILGAERLLGRFDCRGSCQSGGFGLAAALFEDEVVALGGDLLGPRVGGAGAWRDEPAAFPSQ